MLMGALDDPPVLAELPAGLDVPPSDARRDPAAAAGLAATSMVLGLVGVELVRPAPRPARLAADRRDAVEQLVERHGVVGVGPRQDEGERDAGPLAEAHVLQGDAELRDRERAGKVVAAMVLSMAPMRSSAKLPRLSARFATGPACRVVLSRVA